MFTNTFVHILFDTSKLVPLLNSIVIEESKYNLSNKVNSKSIFKLS
jgi:hypothetical protein